MSAALPCNEGGSCDGDLCHCSVHSCALKNCNRYAHLGSGFDDDTRFCYQHAVLLGCPGPNPPCGTPEAAP